MEPNEYTMGNSTYTQSHPNAYTGGGGFPADNAAAGEVQDRMEIKNLLKKGNALRIATLVAVVLFGTTAVLLQFKNAYDIDQIRESVKQTYYNVSNVSRDVKDIANDVYDIMEQGCNGSAAQGATEPVEPIPFDPGLTVDKPAIYLYPEEDNEKIQLKLSLYRTDMLSTWPEPDATYGYEYYWNVYADRDGTIRDMKNDEYSYIFWEATDHGIHDFSKAFCVAGEDTADFLKEKLAEIGLDSREANDFIVYWLPRMQDNAYNLITFEGLVSDDAYNSFYGLEVTDSDGNAADSVLRVLMVWKSVDSYTETEPQSFEKFERNGFTVVEWGGVELEDEAVKD
ncbi:MAG: hypothetical protein K6B44_06580 [Lachnospiraceae bacterium]|nr:hypothetical protein [Lachnospiraceae bacterium]